MIREIYKKKLRRMYLKEFNSLDDGLRLASTRRLQGQNIRFA
jgi:hypothetical protein